MTFELYAIKDELAGTFGNIMVINPIVKERTFKWMTQEMEKSDCEDKRVYHLGQYDTETGMITPCTPELEWNIEQVKKNMEGKKDG